MLCSPGRSWYLPAWFKDCDCTTDKGRTRAAQEEQRGFLGAVTLDLCLEGCGASTAMGWAGIPSRGKQVCKGRGVWGAHLQAREC